MKRLLRSFIYAFHGLAYAWQHEANFKLHCAIALLVLVGALLKNVSAFGLALLALAISGVLGLELVNTVIERLMDALSARVHPLARDMKDMMAGAVLVASLGAVGVGVVVFMFL